MNLEDLLLEVEANHSYVSGARDATQQLDNFATASGFPIPEDMRAFCTRFQRATLFDCYQLLPISQWQRTGAALCGEEWEDSEPPSWFAFCDVFDGDYVGIDLSPNPEGTNSILDCDHEDIGRRAVIANSFAEFLGQALGTPDGRFYLQPEFHPLREIKVAHNPPLAWLRREYAHWAEDPEVGPAICRAADCSRSCVAVSVFCRRHHFEAINGLPYPFE